MYVRGINVTIIYGGKKKCLPKNILVVRQNKRVEKLNSGVCEEWQEKAETSTPVDGIEIGSWMGRVRALPIHTPTKKIN